MTPQQKADAIRDRRRAEETQVEWREQIGQRLMLMMLCQHDDERFGPGAVCETCFATVQKIGALIENVAGNAWDQGRLAERHDWELTADISTPDEDRQPLPNPYRSIPSVDFGGNA